MMTMLDQNGLSEEEYLKQYDDSKYPKPSLTADNVIITDTHEILLVKRGNHPFIGQWALPGGFANKNEPIENTAARELYEETGLKDVHEELVGVYSKPHRDPRGWVVSVAFKAIIPKARVKAGDDARAACWFKIKGERLTHGSITLSFDDLAFDHADIVRDALK